MIFFDSPPLERGRHLWKPPKYTIQEKFGFRGCEISPNGSLRDLGMELFPNSVLCRFEGGYFMSRYFRPVKKV